MFPYIYIFGKRFGTYGVMMAAGCLVAFFFSFRKSKRENISLEDLLILCACALGTAILSAGILYALVTYSPSQIWKMIQKADFSFMEGAVFYGGLIGGVLGALLGLKITKCPFSAAERAIVPYIPLGHAFGRVGCVLAGCCYGIPYEGPLALYYPHAISGISAEQGHFPVQLVEALLNVAVCLYLRRYSETKRPSCVLLCRYLQIYASLRFVLEFLRADVIRGIYGGLSVSQWISIGLFIGAGGSIFLASHRARGRDTH